MPHSFASRIRKFTEKNVNLILFASLALGFIMPGADKIPIGITTILLAVVMFFSCSKITLTHLKEVNALTSAWFIAFRYLVVPIAVYYALLPVDFSVALIGALTTLAPAGVITTALAALFGGNAAFALMVTVVTHLLFIFAAPLYLSYMAGKEIPIDSVSLLLNLVYMIAIPITLFALTLFFAPRAVPPVKTGATTVTVLSIAAVIVILVARVRGEVFADTSLLVSGFFWVTLVFALNYLLWGWALGWKQPLDVRNAMAITSGANNPALPIVIAGLYFPSKVQVLAIIAEVVWIIAVPLYRMFLTRMTARAVAAQR